MKETHFQWILSPLFSGVENSQASEAWKNPFWPLGLDVDGKSSPFCIPYLRKKLPQPHPIKQSSASLRINNRKIPPEQAHGLLVLGTKWPVVFIMSNKHILHTARGTWNSKLNKAVFEVWILSQLAPVYLDWKIKKDQFCSRRYTYVIKYPQCAPNAWFEKKIWTSLPEASNKNIQDI